jgi:trans-aconitate methyltransferase
MTEVFAAETYDQKWETQWDDMKRYGPYSRHVRRWIHYLIAPLKFSSVLDAGCGQGELLTEIRARYPQVQQIAGVDFSPTSVTLTRERLGQGEFAVLDLQTEHLVSQYDLVVCIDVLEHIPDDQAALRQLHAMTGKYLLVGTVQGNSLPDWEARVVGHVRNYARGELQQKVEQAGFKVERLVEWGFPFYSPLYRWILTLMQGQGTGGKYGWRQRLLAGVIYQLFRLNSARRGDLIFVLARPQR